MNDYSSFIDECAKLSWAQFSTLLKRLGLPLAQFSATDSPAWRADVLFNLCRRKGISLSRDDILGITQGLANDSSSTSHGGIALAFSGGGLRATFFHLGVMAYYSATNRLHEVRCITAVSGGSILAAHAGLNWERLLTPDSFVGVMGDLVRFTQTNIRNQVLIPWLWSLAIGWRWLGSKRKRWLRSRTGRLMQIYDRQFGCKSITELKGEPYPFIAFVTTDTLNAKRVYFSNDEIRLFNISDNQAKQSPKCPIDMIPVAFAVAASSCFPPVFRPLDFDYRTLGVLHEEYPELMRLQDGGVHDNLGLRALSLISYTRNVSFQSVCASSAANPMKATRPKTGFIWDHLNALSIHSRGENVEIAHELLGVGEAKVVTPKLSDRLEPNKARLLPTDVQTALMQYRTDLDCPTEIEMFVLMAHGFQVTAARHGDAECDLMNRGEKIILGILDVGCKGTKEGKLRSVSLDNLNANSLNGCGSRPKSHLLFHLAAIVVVYAVIVALLLLYYY